MATTRHSDASDGNGAESSSAGASDEESYFKPLVDGDVLEASAGQRVVVAIVFALGACGSGRALLQLARSGTSPLVAVVGCLIALICALEFADIGSGVYHWALDNYGDGSTPIMGPQIEAFQGHHEQPWTITYRDFCNNCYRSGIATIPFLALFNVTVSSPYVLLWTMLSASFIAFSQEIHKWAHTLRSQSHPVVNWLQDRGILVARRAHHRHHRPPFETNYCIVTGHMNRVLDSMKFFRGLEALIVRINGVHPRCETGERFNHLVDRKPRRLAMGAAQ